MKRFIFLLTAIFICTIAYAETITINWGVDNQPYTTTQCEIGGDVVLPPVSKRGHIFKGWIAEHFNRGTFVNWADVPSNTNLYEKDFYNNRVPTEGDYIIVNDCAQYGMNFDKKMKLLIANKTVSLYDESGPESKFINSYVYTSPAINFDDNVRVYTVGERNRFSVIRRIKYNNRIYNPGEEFFNYNVYVNGNNGTYYFYEPTSFLSGTWKFVYHGNWETDARNGWTPVEQIGE